MGSDGFEMRPASEADVPQILELLQGSLGWTTGERSAAFYRWKHHDNPFGVSPAWVAVVEDRIVGLRIWLRWRFTDGTRSWDAVRAVDTATHPDFRERGIFHRMTTASLEQLRAQGIAHVFNTPNEQARRGYLEMGWEEVGTLPVAVRFRSPMAAASMVRSRVAPERWSVVSGVGSAALDVLADDDEVAGLLASMPATGIRTDLDVEVLRWRYGFDPLRYRGVRMRDGGGIGLFRLRRRGSALECVVGHLLAPDETARRRLLARIAKVSGADQVLELTHRPHLAGGFLPLPGGGPVLTWRGLNDTVMPPLGRWHLAMGDVELF